MPDTPKPSQTLARLRENLLLGLLSLAPLALTLWLLISFVMGLDAAVYQILPEFIAPRNIIGFNIPGLGIVAAILLLLVAGAATRTVLGKLMEQLSDSFFSRIPLLGGLYKTARQVSNVFFSKSSASAFKKVVYVPFPASPARTLAFVTGHSDETHTQVFVPTAPNPTGGYVILYPNSVIESCDLPVESALKIILSCGAVSGKNLETEGRD